jgi:hypothetical protein
MALNRYVLTADVTITPGTAVTLVAGEPGTGAPAGPGNAATTGGELQAVTYHKGQVIMLDPAGSVYAAIGAGNLRAFTQGTDDISHFAGVSN